MNQTDKKILDLLAQGHSNKEIAFMLGITPKYVSTRLAAIAKNKDGYTEGQHRTKLAVWWSENDS